MLSYFQSFSDYNYNNHVADDSSTVYDADTVIPDEVPSLPPMPPLSTLTATASATDYIYNNNNGSPHSSQKESPATTISELLRRINSRRSLAMPSTATATRSEEIEISTNQSSSSSQTSSTTKRQLQNEAKWRNKFEQLCEYRRSNGHTSVSNRWKDNRQLGRWVIKLKTIRNLVYV